jgi:hypothetical protein
MQGAPDLYAESQQTRETQVVLLRHCNISAGSAAIANAQ